MWHNRTIFFMKAGRFAQSGRDMSLGTVVLAVVALSHL